MRSRDCLCHTLTDRIKEMAYAEARKEQERWTHRLVMQHGVLHPVTLEWKDLYGGMTKTARYAGLDAAAFVKIDGECRWTVGPAQTEEGLTPADFLAGKCQSLEEAVAGATQALTMLIREAQDG
jgi:hypothetical protein